MPFTEDKLGDYLLRSKLRQPQKVAMNWLKNLLFKELNEYCNKCISDRMLCVLSPACTERILLKVRMQAEATPDQLPKFCYEQSVNNFKRYIEKKTTLYEPMDVWLFLKDYLEIMFPKIKLDFFRQNLRDVKEIHKAIKKTNIPAVNLDLHNVDYKTFKRIIEKDKLIRENTFVYEIWDNLMLVWFEGQLSVCDFTTDLAFCNVCYDFIDNLSILNMVFRLYCAEMNILNTTEFLSDSEILLTLKVPFSEASENIKANSKYLDDFIVYLERFFFGIRLQVDKDNNFIVTMSYQNVEKLLDRIGMNFITYEGIKTVIKKFFTLTHQVKDET